MTAVYAYTRSRAPQTGEVLLVGNTWVESPAPMAEVLAMTMRTQAGACAVDPGLGVNWRAVDKLAPGAAATAQYVIEQSLARYVVAGLIRNVAVTATNTGTRIDYTVTYVDTRQPAARPRIRGIF